jgi:uncharacterized circularly permuted ATP-grasp superfamily protein
MAELHNQVGAWDELLDDDGQPRPVAAELVAQLHSMGTKELRARQAAAELEILRMGITFTVYADEGGIDRAWPFDVIPRVIDAAEWQQIEAGLVQRLVVLNRFIDDLYNDRHVVKDGVFPNELLDDSANYRRECQGVRPPLGVWAHISGSDLVRDRDGLMYVLEDNLRVPSGVSYLLENRAISKRAFADLFQRQSILPVDGYTDELSRLLASIAPDGIDEPTVVLLTPGIYNSAYFEHSFLAQRMGVALVEGRDLVVGDDDCVYMRTIGGPQRVHVVYRRIDDLFLDPEVFRPDSTLGVPGLIRAWKAGNVGIANAPGAGVADDKVVYAWVPDLIRYYTGEEPLLPNVPTYRCLYADERRFVIDNIGDLVVKPANESGGAGLLIGNRSTPEERAERIEAIEAEPRKWVAQPILTLSTGPTLCDGTIEPRHLDLRPFILTGRTSYVTKGGLTRVALRAGSLVVNSSQGGGSKDTWIVDGLHPPHH